MDNNKAWLDDVNSVEYIPILASQAAFLSVDAERPFREAGEILPVRLENGLEYMPWGADNKMPYKVMDMIEADETMTTCLQFTAELLYGSGLRYVDDECSAAVKSEISDFWLDNDMASYFMGVCQDFKHFAFAVSVVMLNAEGSKIVGLSRKEACYCRFAPADKKGKISKILYSNWRKESALDAESVETIELLDFASPWRDLAVRMGRIPGPDGVKSMRSSCRKFAIVSKVPTADSTYYPIPFYASLFRSKWYNIKKLIGIAKESKLKNTAPIKYHIEISSKYWDSLFSREGITNRAAQRERINKEKAKIIEFLTGAENAGKAWFSTFFVSPDGREQHEISISKVDSSKEGGDWESDIQEAVNMICFSMRVHSNLVGSVPGKAQTNNSGSDKRELYTIAQALQKPYHDLLFLPHKIIIKYNGWEPAYPDCPMVQLTTLDENKDSKTVTTHDPD